MWDEEKEKSIYLGFAGEKERLNLQVILYITREGSGTRWEGLESNESKREGCAKEINKKQSAARRFDRLNGRKRKVYLWGLMTKKEKEGGREGEEKKKW